MDCSRAFFISCNLIIVSISVFYLYMNRHFKYWKALNVPYIKPVPIFGNIFDICTGRQSIGKFCESIYRKISGPYVGVFILDEPCLIVKDLEIIKHVLIKDFEHFTNRSICSNDKHDIIGSSQMLILKSPLWFPVRKGLSSEFSTAKIKVMGRASEKASQLLKRYISNISQAQNGVIETRELCNKYSTDSITSAAFGLEGDCFESNDSPFLEISKNYFDFGIIWNAFRMLCFYIAPKLVHILRIKFIDGDTEKLLKNILIQTFNKREVETHKRNDIVDRLLTIRELKADDGTDLLATDNIIGIASSIYGAGFETTSNAMSLGLLELALQPKIQDKIRNEIIAVKNQFGSICYESLKEMKYLECTIKETLRKYPTLPFLDRRCNKTYTIPNTNVTLQKGDIVYISILGIHMDEAYYPDPEKFDPDRFREDIARTRPALAYLPFGEGPRFCIGRTYALMNIKCGLAHILSEFQVDVCHKTEHKVEMNALAFLLQPKRGIFLKFSRLELNS